MANPGYGKRTTPDQPPRTRHDFALLPPREAAIAAYLDRLPDGADISVKTLAKQLPYGQCALGTALNRLQQAGHLRRGRECVTADDGSSRWITRTWFTRTARMTTGGPPSPAATYRSRQHARLAPAPTSSWPPSAAPHPFSPSPTRTARPSPPPRGGLVRARRHGGGRTACAHSRPADARPPRRSPGPKPPDQQTSTPTRSTPTPTGPGVRELRRPGASGNPARGRCSACRGERAPAQPPAPLSAPRFTTTRPRSAPRCPDDDKRGHTHDGSYGATSLHGHEGREEAP